MEDEHLTREQVRALPIRERLKYWRAQRRSEEDYDYQKDWDEEREGTYR